MCYLLIMMDRDGNAEAQFVVPMTFSKKICAARRTFRLPKVPGPEPAAAKRASPQMSAIRVH
jgi:hypothetical protein